MFIIQTNLHCIQLKITIQCGLPYMKKWKNPWLLSGRSSDSNSSYFQRTLGFYFTLCNFVTFGKSICSDHFVLRCFASVNLLKNNKKINMTFFISFSKWFLAFYNGSQLLLNEVSHPKFLFQLFIDEITLSNLKKKEKLYLFLA